MRVTPLSRRPRSRPHLPLLEDRLPLGDAMLGSVAGLALLPAPTASPGVVESTSVGEPGVLTPGSESSIRGLTPPARQAETLPGPFANDPFDTLPAPAWGALTDL